MDTFMVEQLLHQIIRDCTDNLATEQTLVESVEAFMEDKQAFQEYQRERGKEYTLADLLGLAKSSISEINTMLSELTDDWD